MNEERLLELERKVDALILEIQLLKNPASINPDIVEAVWRGQPPALVSGKSATSERVTINESGTATKTTLGEPDRFILIGGQNVPAYD